MRSVSSTQPAASHHWTRVYNCLTVAGPRHGAVAPHRTFMGIKIILLLLFLQKQSLAFAVYLFGIGTLLAGLGS